MLRSFGPFRELLITAALLIAAVVCVYLWLATSPVWGLLYGAAVAAAAVRIRSGRRETAGERTRESSRDG